MCYSSGSIDHAVNPCPMCRVYNHHKCPHIRETCRNRASHPRMDVLYLTNAEVDCFNGCGFCKWAAKNPQAGYLNPGWPGCCRPPLPSEYSMVQVEDWSAVSIVHHVPIPPQFAALLKSLPMPPTNRSKPSAPSSARKTVNGAKSKSPNAPSLSRGHPSISRTPSETAISSSVPSSSSLDTMRRKAASDRLAEGANSSNPSPKRKSIDIDTQNVARRLPSVRSPSITPATTSVSLSKVVAADSRSQSSTRDLSVKRRSSISISASPSPTNVDTPASFLVPRSEKNDDECSTSSSGSGSSDGLDSLSDSTVTSDGGFTDYLSEESEAELQRQAEAKAAVVAQNQLEELEFKLARQQLADIDLQPPRLWNPTNNNGTPRKASNSPVALIPRHHGTQPTSFSAVATALLHSGR